MARDPDTFRVSPALTNLPMVVAPPVQDAGPQQLVEAGQAITRAGGVAASLYEDALKEQNQVRVTEALTQLTERRNEMTYGEAGWASQTGKNALKRPDGKTLDEEFGGEFDSTIETLEMSLGNDAQRRMFRENAQRMSLDLRGKIQSHATEQGRTYKLEVNAGVVDTGSRQLALAATPEERAEAKALIERGANAIFAIKGTPEGDARAEIMRGLLTPGHVAQLERFAASEDLDGFSAYLAENKDDLTTEAETKFTTWIAEQQSLKTAEGAGIAAFDQVFGAGAANAPPVKGSLVPVSNGGTLLRQILPGAVVTSTYRPPDHVLSRANPNSWHTKSKAAVDIKPIAGMTFEQAKAQIERQGYHLIEAIDEAKNPSKNATGPHWHFVIGSKDGKNATPVRATGSLEDARRAIYEREDLTDKQKAHAWNTVKDMRQARDYDRKEREDNLLSQAYAEADKLGKASNAAISRLISAGLGASIPALRSFEKATQERRSGKPVGTADSLEAYGRVAIGIADGEVGSFDQLLKFKPYLSDSQFKQLADQLAKAPRSAQTKAAQIIEEMKPHADGSGLFVDEDGKPRKDRYNQFVGSVISTIEGRELNTGKPVSKEERREIVLGLLQADVVDGKKVQNFEIRQLYDSIPARARINATRALQARGVKNPSVADIVNVWNQVDPRQRRLYEGR